MKELNEYNNARVNLFNSFSLSTDASEHYILNGYTHLNWFITDPIEKSWNNSKKINIITDNGYLIVIPINLVYKDLNNQTTLYKMGYNNDAIYSKDGEYLSITNHQSSEYNDNYFFYVLCADKEIKNTDFALNAIKHHYEEYNGNDDFEEDNIVDKESNLSLISVDLITMKLGYIDENNDGINQSKEIENTKPTRPSFFKQIERKSGSPILDDVKEECKDFDDDLPF